MMDYAKGRIVHAHLKDQTAKDGRKYVTLGLGAVPNEKIVKAMVAARYDGWYTLENPVCDTYDDTIRQTALLTGVSKFSKESIFSDLNNLIDVTPDASTATLLSTRQGA